nr:MAG TPA: hypothetical protein [Bacteriophage sp.]
MSNCPMISRSSNISNLPCLPKLGNKKKTT